MAETLVIIVMGVSGSGKTTVGARLAERLGWDFADADDFHTPGDIARMSAGIPLTDTEREPWLRSIAEWIEGRLTSETPAVVTCSGLRRRYREVLAGGRPGVAQVFLDEGRDVIARRMERRREHFFRPGLLDSQFRDLERPTPDEGVVTVENTGTPEETVVAIVSELELETTPAES
ncbi:gluconokinase [Actinomadura sp. SCN-SB]|uniref:gluconokinase n=1 Tax=Actinomadura sp. SCN-SB TaxID=3373092 RepID=UPI003753C584